MPPVRPFVHSRFSGTLTLAAQHNGQQVPASFAFLNLKGGLQSTAAHLMPSQVSTAAVGEKTGAFSILMAAPAAKSCASKHSAETTLERSCIAAVRRHATWQLIELRSR